MESDTIFSKLFISLFSVTFNRQHKTHEKKVILVKKIKLRYSKSDNHDGINIFV